MYEKKVLKLKDMPVFSLSDMAQIVSGKEYAKKLVRKKVSEGEIKRIKRDVYTFYNDPFLVSTFLVKPSYISSVSALSYHKLITQIPKDVFCFTSKRKNKFHFLTDIYFVHTSHFFGFDDYEYQEFEVPIAIPEKAIIDSVGTVPFSVFEEAITNIDRNRMVEYLLRVGKSSIIKRIGYLMERHGLEVNGLNSKINSKYIYLDPFGNKKGKKNKKWKVRVNI